MANISSIRLGRKFGTTRLSNRMNTVFLTLDECIENRRLYPALTLIYTTIDILGSLQDPNGYASRANFIRWATDYLFKSKSFPFNEYDLYGARCGIVHTMRYDSQDTTLKTIIYGFRGHDKDIQKITDPTKQVGVYVEDLRDALRTEYLNYLNFLEMSTDTIINTNLDRLPDYEDQIEWH